MRCIRGLCSIQSPHMKVILLQDVRGVGRKHEVKEVSEGYAHNFLFPQRVAEVATPGKIAAAKAEKDQVLQAEAATRAYFMQNIDALRGAKVIIAAKANEKGHLFEGIKKDQILKAIESEYKIKLPSDALKLAAPLKTTGDHTLEAWYEKRSAVFTISIQKA